MQKTHVSLPLVPPDFEADLRFLTPEEGGRQGPVYQGYKPDFRYAGDPVGQQPMIWPVFIGEDEEMLPEGEPIYGNVQARMYIVADEARETVHRKRLQEGVQFFLQEGLHVVAEGTVIRILALHDER